MIADTSALLAVVLGEADAEAHLALMAAADSLSVSAATLVEALIVAEAKQGLEAASDLHALLADLDATIIDVDEPQALLASAAWRRFGKGRHPAGLNYGDTFAYALAVALAEPLLYKGDDFSATDVAQAMRSMTIPRRSGAASP